MELLQTKILGVGRGKDKKEGGTELWEARGGGSMQGRTFMATQSIMEATNTSRRGVGSWGREKGEARGGNWPSEWRQLPGRLPRGSNLQLHLSPQILGQTSLV